MDKTLKQIQKEVDNWASQFKKPYFCPLSRVLCILEEASEIGEIVNGLYGDKKPKREDDCTKEQLAKELADLLFTTICMANTEEIDLTEEFNKIFEKFNTRDKDRWEKK